MKRKKLQKDALKYLRYKDMIDQIPEEEIQRFREETKKAFETIKLLEVTYVNNDPYDSIEDLVKKIDDSGELLVTRSNNNSRLLPGETNLQFRALHDYLHYVLGSKFTYEGELEVYKAQKKHYSTEIGRKILYSEVVLQAAYKEYFGKFAEYQKVII